MPVTITRELTKDLNLAKALIVECRKRVAMDTLAAAVGCSTRTLERILYQPDYAVTAATLYGVLEHGANMRKCAPKEQA